MDLVAVNTCDVCGKKEGRTLALYSLDDQLPPPEWKFYVPPGWHHIAGVTMCADHSYRLVIEREGQPHRPVIEIEQHPNARAQPFVWTEEKSHD